MAQSLTVNELKENYIGVIIDRIEDIYFYDYNEDIVRMESEQDDIDDDLNDHIFEIINDSYYVIYTHAAKEVIEVLGYFDPFDIGDITGARFENYSQCAFENIYRLIYDDINPNILLDNFIGQKLKEKKINVKQ